MSDVDTLNEPLSPVKGPNPLSQDGVVGESTTETDTMNQGGGGNLITSESGDINKIQAQGSSSNKKAPKASSGMFTNIQKYVEKNRPQAKNMVGAVTGDISKQASDIRKAVEKKQDDQNVLIRENTNLIGNKEEGTGAYGMATGTVDQIMTGTEATQPVASTDEFQGYMAGNIDGVNKVQDLNLAQQQMRTDALSQLAGRADTEQGRRDLLGQTFQKQGNYNRGMSNIDQIITSGDKAARESLIQGTQGAANQLQTDVGGVNTNQAKLLQAQRDEMSGFKKYATDLALNPYDDIFDEATIRAEKFKNLDIGSEISDSDLEAAGLTREQVANLYGVDPSVAFGGIGATAEQIRRMDGLGELLGKDPTHFQEFKTQDFLDQVARQKALYDKDYIQGSQKYAADAINKQWGGNTSYYNALMKELDSLYDTGVSTDGDDSGLGGWASNRIHGSTTDTDGSRTTYKNLYDKMRKEEEARVQREYKYGQGLHSGTGDKLVRDYSNTGVKTGGTRRS